MQVCGGFPFPSSGFLAGAAGAAGAAAGIAAGFALSEGTEEVRLLVLDAVEAVSDGRSSGISV